MSRGTFWAERVWTGAPTPQARGLRSGADMALAVPGAGPIEAPAAGGGELARSVLIEVAGGRIVRLTPGVPAPPEAVRLGGLVLPGLVNAHSHVFQRALRGRTHRGAGSFWTWRTAMYELAARLDPTSLFRLARATYAEMALAGITTVGEFHYLHHDPSGRRYADPNAMGRAVIAGAKASGLRLTLIDTCYLRGGFEEPLEGAQVRFGDADVEAWAERVDGLRGDAQVRIGAAAHSVRAVDEAGMSAVAAWARRRSAPLHIHLSEQPAENEECLRATGKTPAELCAATGVLGPQTTAVHATHVSRAGVALLGRTSTGVCMCPSTERDLGDGIGPAASLVRAGSPLSLGSDGHAVIDMFEEARAVELHERLKTGRRGIHATGELLAAAGTSGMGSLGWDGGVLQGGAPADFISVTFDSVRLAGADDDTALDHVVFAATAEDVSDVVVGGRQIVSQGRHATIPDVPQELAHVITSLHRTGP